MPPKSNTLLDNIVVVLDHPKDAGGLIENAVIPVNSRDVTVTAIVSGKNDGSGKGGVTVAIQQELGIAPRIIGTGEEPDDFDAFSREEFVEKIL